MTDPKRNPFVERHWPPLLIGCAVLILWYTLGGNAFAGAGGFLGLGWLAWEKWIKPRL